VECGWLHGGALSMKDQRGGEKVLEVAQLLPDFAALAGRRENHVLTTTLCLAFEVALAGDTGLVDGVTFLSHAVVLFLLFLLSHRGPLRNPLHRHRDMLAVDSTSIIVQK
jgi:hypothetical protein